MFPLSFKLILIAVFVNQLTLIHTLDTVIKNSKPSKHTKPESLKAPESEPIKLDDEEDSTEPISALGITVPPEFENETIVQDHHIFYNSTFYNAPEQAQQYWINMNSSNHKVTLHEMLSNSHRQATTVELTFDFPFYGHLLRNITIATGGFLYMGDYIHNWIAATQYVAPLMANFDTSQGLESQIKYADNGTTFTVQWENAYIQDQKKYGGFTFQVTLFKDGNIVFAYKSIPYPVANISDTRHPVKIGISDAYILERALFFVRRKTIYEYHRIDMLKRKISNNTALYFTALPTCPGYKDCTSCLAANPKLECNWCETLKRCSNGIDRGRQTWVSNGCATNKPTTCSAQSTSTATENSFVGTGDNRETEALFPRKSTESATKLGDQSTSKDASSFAYGFDSTSSATGASDNDIQGPARYVQADTSLDGGMSIGAIVTIVIFVLASIGVGTWIGYAYWFPQTASGQFLIKYRPSQWTMKTKEDGNAVISSSQTF